MSALGVTGQAGPLRNHLLTGGSDGLIKVWDLKDTVEPVQIIDLKGKLSLDIEVGSLPGSGGKSPLENSDCEISATLTAGSADTRGWIDGPTYTHIHSFWRSF